MKNLYALVTFFIFSIAFGQNPTDIDFSFNMSYQDYFFDYMGSGKKINDFAIQSDGKIILVGKMRMTNHFHKVDSNLRSVIRLNSDMTFDNTFNSGTGFNNNVEKVVV